MAPGEHLYRLVTLTPDQLDPQQRVVYEEITSGPRARAAALFRLVESDGSLTGPFDAMLHAPKIGTFAQRLGSALRSQSMLTARDREIAILTVASYRRSGYEWYAHEPAGRACGIAGGDLTRLHSGDFDQIVEPRDRTVAISVAELLESRALSEARLRQLRQSLTLEQVVELVILVGYYDMLSLLMSALRSPMPQGVADPFPA